MIQWFHDALKFNTRYFAPIWCDLNLNPAQACRKALEHVYVFYMFSQAFWEADDIDIASIIINYHHHYPYNLNHWCMDQNIMMMMMMDYAIKGHCHHHSWLPSRLTFATIIKFPLNQTSWPLSSLKRTVLTWKSMLGRRSGFLSGALGLFFRGFCC